MATLRSFIFIDQMQPQTMCYLGSWIRGSLPRTGMAAQIIEVAPGLRAASWWSSGSSAISSSIRARPPP